MRKAEKRVQTNQKKVFRAPHTQVVPEALEGYGGKDHREAWDQTKWAIPGNEKAGNKNR